jgi:hypothetical protein
LKGIHHFPRSAFLHHLRRFRIIVSLVANSFKSCKSLPSVTFEAGRQLSSLGEYAFGRCSLLQSICITSSVEAIPNCCFACEKLLELTFEVRISNQILTFRVWANLHFGDVHFNRSVFLHQFERLPQLVSVLNLRWCTSFWKPARAFRLNRCRTWSRSHNSPILSDHGKGTVLSGEFQMTLKNPGDLREIDPRYQPTHSNRSRF